MYLNSRAGNLRLECGGGLHLTAGTAITESDAQVAVIPFAGKEQDEKGQTGNHQDVENTEEDGSSSNTDLVSSIGQTPGNGVQEPQHIEPNRENNVVLVNTKELSSLATLVDGAHCKNKPAKGTEGKESPLVARRHEGTDKVANRPLQSDGDIA